MPGTWAFFVEAKPFLGFFFLAPAKEKSHFKFDLVRVKTPKNKTGSLAYFFGGTVFGFFVALSGENANLDCDLVDISPRKKPPGTWVFYGGETVPVFFFRAPWKKK